MIDLDKNHIRLLQKTKKQQVIRTDKRNLKDIEYLLENELITAVSYDTDQEFFCQPKITEKGKAVLYEWKSSRKRTDIALVLSICAIVLSILTAFTPFSDWSRAWIENLIRSLF